MTPAEQNIGDGRRGQQPVYDGTRDAARVQGKLRNRGGDQDGDGKSEHSPARMADCRATRIARVARMSGAAAVTVSMWAFPVFHLAMARSDAGWDRIITARSVGQRDRSDGILL